MKKKSPSLFETFNIKEAEKVFSKAGQTKPTNGKVDRWAELPLYERPDTKNEVRRLADDMAKMFLTKMEKIAEKVGKSHAFEYEHGRSMALAQGFEEFISQQIDNLVEDRPTQDDNEGEK